jgi:hypothetical protein
VEELEEKKRHSAWKILFWVFFWVALLIISLIILSFAGVIFEGTSVGLGFSSNAWAGYTTTSNILSPQPSVTGVSGSWAVPQIQASQSDTFSAVWIGIGGQFDSTLIQVGTEQDSVNGKLYYSAWYEMLPAYSVSIDTIDVSPGDQMSASINLENPSTIEWSISISDLTTGKQFENSFVYNSSKLSAEWIIERPKINDSLSGLAQFGTVSFTDLKATINNSTQGIGSFSFSRLTMHNSQHVPLVSVSPFTNSDPSSFSIAFLRSS